MYCVLISVGHIHIVLTARTATTMRGGVAQQCYGNASNYGQDRQTDRQSAYSQLGERVLGSVLLDWVWAFCVRASDTFSFMATGRAGQRQPQ